MADFLEQFRSTAAVEVSSLSAPHKPRKPSSGKPSSAYAPVPLAWAARAAQATNSPATAVLVEIVFLAWRAKGAPFPLSNARLGVSRKFKCRILRDLERAGLIAVQWRSRQAPVVTLLVAEPEP